MIASSSTLEPPKIELRKRKSDDDLHDDTKARDKEQKEKREKMKDWVLKKPRQRMREGKRYCCHCENMTRVKDEEGGSAIYGEGKGSVCGSCQHHRTFCLECTEHGRLIKVGVGGRRLK